jgi:Fic family protein
LLARIDLGRGQEALFTDQSPEILSRLAEDARIQSITASNEIEGITVEPGRAEGLAENRLAFRTRSEQEFAGYRDALDELTRSNHLETVTVPYILHLHRLIFRYSGGRGGHLKADPNLIVSRASGKQKTVYTPPSPEESPFLLQELIDRYLRAKTNEEAHPLLLLSAFIVDVLAIHPVADGNGRLARLLATHELLLTGYGVARYVSVEKMVLDSKRAYYSSLAESQKDWRDGNNEIWPFAKYFLTIVSEAYDIFEQRLASAASRTGPKSEQVREFILNEGPAVFERRSVERALPGISPATIRKVLNSLRDDGLIRSDGLGRSAKWHRID